MIKKQLTCLRLPDYITLAGLFSSLAATFFLFSDPARIVAAYLCILGQLIADFFDGRLARKMQRQDQLGVHLDSYADLYTIANVMFFGIALGIDHPARSVIFPVFVVAAAVRLAYFTTHTVGSTSREFTGLPTTVVSFLLPSLLVLNTFSTVQMPINAFLLLYALCAFLMVSSFRIRKF